MTQEQISELTNQWNRHWNQLEPISENVRHESENWVRFHMLPESKRYPETPDEYATILDRHAQLISMLDPGKSLVAITSSWTMAADDVSEHNPKITLDKYVNYYWRTVKAEPETFRQLYAGECEWPSDTINQILRKVADDEIEGVIFAPRDFKWLYLPYDGGVDIVTYEKSIHGSLVSGFPDWLAPEWKAAQRT